MKISMHLQKRFESIVKDRASTKQAQILASLHINFPSYQINYASTFFCKLMAAAIVPPHAARARRGAREPSPVVAADAAQLKGAEELRKKKILKVKKKCLVRMI